MKYGSFKIFLFGFVGILSAAEKTDRLELVWADSVVVEKSGTESVQKLFGRVQMVQGEAFMRCDRAVYREQENRAKLSGHVILYDGKHRLWADEVDYDGVHRIETATGHVRFQTGERTLRSDWLQYDQEAARVQVRGNVHFEDMIEKAVLTGQFADYDRKADYGWVEGDPVLTKVDTSSHDTLRIFGRKMEAWGGEQRVVVTDSVRILKGDVDGSCTFAEYAADSSRMTLSGGLPKLRQKDQEMTGDTIVIRLEETRFSGGMIVGKAQIISRDSTSENVLRGKRIFIEADADTIRKVIVEGQAYSRFWVSDKEKKEDDGEGINTITGDRMIMTFEDNQVTWIKVESSPGLCEGRYVPANADTVKTDLQGKEKRKKVAPPS